MLIGNYSVLNKTPGRWRGGAPLSHTAANFNKSGANRNRYVGDGEHVEERDGVPRGYTPPYSYVIPQISGGLASVNFINGSGQISPMNLAGGLNAEVTMSGFGEIDSSSAGALVVSAVVAMAGIGGLSADIVGKLEASITMAGSSDLSAALSALAGAVVEMGGSSAMTPSIRAIGNISADITPFTELSPQNLAAAIWNALAADLNNPGTMGEKLNAAGTAGDPWTTDLDGYITDGTAGKRLKELLSTIQFLALK